MADCEVEQAYPVEPDVVDLSDSINDVSIREQALEPQQAAMNDVKGEPIKSGNKDGPPKGGDGVVHVGSSGGGASIGCEEEVPWENRLCEAADRDGETLVTVGPLPAAEMGPMLERLAQVAATVQCDTSLIHTQEHPSKDKEAEPLGTTFTLVRKRPCEGHHLDLRVAVVGNVDAGKSTLVGVMTGPVSFLDDGRGLARSRVLRHKHEAETGRTSSIAEDQHMRLNTKGLSLAAERHQKAVADAAETAKVVSFIDLAGHERYLRTTVYGLTAHEPDYVMVVVGANHGITRMTKEHVGMAIALNVPLFVVVTKVRVTCMPPLSLSAHLLTPLRCHLLQSHLHLHHLSTRSTSARSP